MVLWWKESWLFLSILYPSPTGQAPFAFLLALAAGIYVAHQACHLLVTEKKASKAGLLIAHFPSPSAFGWFPCNPIKLYQQPLRPWGPFPLWTPRRSSITTEPCRSSSNQQCPQAKDLIGILWIPKKVWPRSCPSLEGELCHALFPQSNMQRMHWCRWESSLVGSTTAWGICLSHAVVFMSLSFPSSLSLSLSACRVVSYQLALSAFCVAWPAKALQKCQN